MALFLAPHVILPLLIPLLCSLSSSVLVYLGSCVAQYFLTVHTLFSTFYLNKIFIFNRLYLWARQITTLCYHFRQKSPSLKILRNKYTQNPILVWCMMCFLIKLQCLLTGWLMMRRYDLWNCHQHQSYFCFMHMQVSPTSDSEHDYRFVCWHSWLSNQARCFSGWLHQHVSW